jgi:hypothetical protein
VTSNIRTAATARIDNPMEMRHTIVGILCEGAVVLRAWPSLREGERAALGGPVHLVELDGPG